VASDGAMGINQAWEAHKIDHWRIEEARTADALMSGGITQHNGDYIEAALRAFDWGFAHQAADGSFAGTNDAFHSTSFFIEAAARSLYCLSVSPYAKAYAKELDRDRANIHSAALWFTNDEMWNAGVVGNEPYGHRRFLVPAALCFAALYTGDMSLLDKARPLLEKGLSLQAAEGYNPEKGGYDTNYNSLGLLLAMRWAMNLPDDPITPRVNQMIERGMQWEASKILPTGEISSEGNTRTGVGLEKTLDGKPKIMQKTSTLRAFVVYDCWHATTKYDSIVRKIHTFYSERNM